MRHKSNEPGALNRRPDALHAAALVEDGRITGQSEVSE